MISTHTLIVNSNGQITVPAKYRKAWGLKPNTKIVVKISNDKHFSIIDIQNYSLDDIPSILGKLPNISEDDIQKELKKAFKPGL